MFGIQKTKQELQQSILKLQRQINSQTLESKAYEYTNSNMFPQSEDNPASRHEPSPKHYSQALKQQISIHRNKGGARSHHERQLGHDLQENTPSKYKENCSWKYGVHNHHGERAQLKKTTTKLSKVPLKMALEETVPKQRVCKHRSHYESNQDPLNEMKKTYDLQLYRQHIQRKQKKRQVDELGNLLSDISDKLNKNSAMLVRSLGRLKQDFNNKYSDKVQKRNSDAIKCIYSSQAAIEESKPFPPKIPLVVYRGEVVDARNYFSGYRNSDKPRPTDHQEQKQLAHILKKNHQRVHYLRGFPN